MSLKIPCRWLSEWVTLPPSVLELASRLSLAGLEVESIATLGETWDAEKLRVAEVLTIEPHPNADRLCLCTVAYGEGEPLQIVTGAPNLMQYLEQPLPRPPLQASLKVPLALSGAQLIDGHHRDGRMIKLRPGKIRGVRSAGMLCSEKELGLSDRHEGILLLPADAPTGQSLREYLGDQVLEFDIKGGFAHLLCVEGVARETAAIFGRPFESLPSNAIQPPGARQVVDPPFVRLAIDAPQGCRRLTATLIEGIQAGESPFWMQQYLLRAGMRPISAVVDVTNYVMLELGQPIHAYDYDLLRKAPGEAIPSLRVRRALPGGEVLSTLDGETHQVPEGSLLIADGVGAVGIAGVMGGQGSEVSAKTTRVLLEAAQFDFASIRQTSQRLKLPTEAAQRFGKHLSPALAARAGWRAAQRIQQCCGGVIHAVQGHAVQGDLYPQPLRHDALTVDAAFVTRILGEAIPQAEQRRILENLGFEVSLCTSASGDEDRLRVTPPAHRMDIKAPIDVVEEIARIHGYDRIQPTLLADDLPPQRRHVQLEGRERVGDLLCGLGLHEVITYTFTDPALERRLGGAPEEVCISSGAMAPPESAGEPARKSTQKSTERRTDAVVVASLGSHVALRNPLSAERSHLRQRLLGGLLQTARENLRFGEEVSLFEIGKLFFPSLSSNGDEDGLPRALPCALPREIEALGVLLCGKKAASWGQSAEEPEFDFYHAKGIVEALLDGLHIEAYTFRPHREDAYHPGRCAGIWVAAPEARASSGKDAAGEVRLGVLGELHPALLRDFDLGGRKACAIEMPLATLFEHWQEDHPLRPLPTVPAVYEDLAFVVDESVTAAQVRDELLRAGAPLLHEARVFDVYRDPKLGSQRKSLAFALTYQGTQTLTEKQVTAVRKRVVARLQAKLEAHLREPDATSA